MKGKGEKQGMSRICFIKKIEFQYFNVLLKKLIHEDILDIMINLIVLVITNKMCYKTKFEPKSNVGI